MNLSLHILNTDSYTHIKIKIFVVSHFHPAIFLSPNESKPRTTEFLPVFSFYTLPFLGLLMSDYKSTSVPLSDFLLSFLFFPSPGKSKGITASGINSGPRPKNLWSR